MATVAFASPDQWLSRYGLCPVRSHTKGCCTPKGRNGNEALAVQNAIVLPAMEKAKAKCFAQFVNDELLNCMGRRMAHYELKGVLAREAVIEKYASRVDRVLADYETMGCY